MIEKDKKRIIERYNYRIKKYGANIKGLASGTQERRNLQFKILSQIGNLSNKKVLDLGCGFGDFYLFMKDQGVKFDYIGIDINPYIISKAKKKLKNVKFICGDILENKISKVDYIIAASTFNNSLSEIGNYDYIEEIFNKCYNLSNIGVAIDFLTDYVDYKINDEVFYYNPERVFSIAKKITKRVTLRHDYPLFQFCIYIYKDFVGWNK